MMFATTKTTLTSVVLFMIAFSLLQESNAQEEAEARWLLGTGITYCSYVQNPGVNLNVTYRLIGNLHIGPDFSAILNSEEIENGTTVVRKELECNVNAHYLFEISKKVAVYPLLGINYSKVTIHPIGGEADKRWVTAMNSGGGIEFIWRKTRLFFESKYVTTLEKYDLTAGILIGLRSKKKLDKE